MIKDEKFAKFHFPDIPCQANSFDGRMIIMIQRRKQKEIIDGT
jgi:hypothetical protein